MPSVRLVLSPPRSHSHVSARVRTTRSATMSIAVSRSRRSKSLANGRRYSTNRSRAGFVDEAVRLGAQLLVTHHPLFLRGTSSVYGGTAKGRLVQRLVTAGCGLYVAHTNADDAPGGVSDTLAATIGVVAPRPLVPSADR